ncbi:MAG TPA: hypothetical protein PLL02_02910 [Bacteroidales bacterium]|jgi:hypothetical protein|nr:hypothetical protein [Bacteroidales bacterium]
MDFTLFIYKSLLTTFQSAGYAFYTFEDYLKCDKPEEKFVILRHDIDAKAGNALATAKVEATLGIRASYYFRIVPQSNQPEIIKQIAAMGHEIGYHYEDLSLSHGDTQKGLQLFKQHLSYFQSFYPVKTVCMHGSPRSPHDSKDLWSVFDYKDLGIIGEPYFDIDFSRLFYLTDTGRRWDGYKVSVRDKIPQHQERWIEEGKVYHKTQDIIKALNNQVFPSQLMLATHPQRWTNNKLQWGKELLSQKAKNIIKRILIRKQ